MRIVVDAPASRLPTEIVPGFSKLTEPVPVSVRKADSVMAVVHGITGARVGQLQIDTVIARCIHAFARNAIGNADSSRR
jgi:hypothetical protein